MVRQFLTLSAGEGVARGLHALAFLALARRFGPAAMGVFGVAQAVASYGMLGVQRGLDVPAMLRVTREPGAAEAVRSAVVRLRAPVFLVLLVGAAIWGNGLLLAMAGMWLAGALQVRWLLLARQESAPVAVGALLASAVFFGASMMGLPLVWVAAALSAGELMASGWYWLAAGGPVREGKVLEKDLQREAWPFFGSLLLGNLLYNLDVFVLGAVRGGTEVGLYVAAFRLLTVFSPVLGALQNSALPQFGRLYPDGAAARRLAATVWWTSASAAMGFAMVLVVGATFLLPLLYGDAFGGAAVVVRVLALVLPVQVTRMVFRQPLLAFRGQKADLRNLAVAVGVNLALDLALAPAYGGLGCAVSTLCAEGCFALLTWRAWRRISCA